ncbi:sigma-E factor negative regulatory protein [Aestuariibacter salexigens]|uniref:sigma-E factor negative regulatory protein n=1 Tax=Aestuariibacter salexigens TaxID=226010 RepID=UPI000425017E|nr:RseA family anti-sigma factor [Aestuariibacter salexigens]
MTQQQEHLSAIIDGEHQDDALIASIASDSQLAERWHRYHVVRAALRKEMPLNGHFDISASVADALEQEPVVLAPKRRWYSVPGAAQIAPLLKQGGQFAIAASVAVAVVFGVQTYNQPESQEPFITAPPVPGVGIQGGLAPVSLQQTRAVPQTDAVEQRQRINAFLTDHQQQLRLKHAGQQETPPQDTRDTDDTSEQPKK